MNKIERVDRVLDGKTVDYPPLSLWYHFGVQHGSGEQHAKLSLEFFRHYDLDFLKVMNDYFYPRPEGLEAVQSRADLEKIRPFDVEASPWSEQFSALSVIARELSGEAYFLDTLFDPWQSLRRNMAGENIEMLMETEPQATHDALEVIADNLIAYCKRSLSIGTAGIFMSIYAGRELISRENFLEFVKPHALRAFEAIQDQGRMNTLHIHGSEALYVEDCCDFPARIFNWWDRGPDGPPLSEVKAKIDGCVMGGIDQKIVSRNTLAHLREHVREGLALGGDTRFFLANGCSIDTWVYPGAVQAVVETARRT